MTFTPPISRGIFLSKIDGEFGEQLVVAAAIKNPTQEDAHLRNMSTKLFTPRLKQRTFTEDGVEHLWSPNTMAGQAVTHRKLKAGKMVVQKWRVPNAEEAYQRAVKTCSELDLVDKSEIKTWIQHYHPVDPNRVGVVQVEVGFPAPDNHYDTLTRQYDLRHNAERKLDDKIPEGDEDAIVSNM